MLAACLLAVQSSIWTSSPDGDLALPQFKSAPYPYKSRADGYSYEGKFYAADTNYSDSTVGVFVPKQFKPGKEINFVVHFHGWNNHVSKVFTDYNLEQEMHMSGLNAVLLVPQGPKDAPDSDGGKLQHEPGSLTALLNEALAFLANQGRIPADAKLGHIALTTHSGGYLVTTYILDRHELYDKITDVILFDSSYGGLPAFADYAAYPGHRLLSICTEHLGFNNLRLVSLLQQRHVQPRVFHDEDVTDADVAKRGATIMFTTTLLHDEVIYKRDYFAKWLHYCRFK